MIHLSDITLRHGSRSLFKDASLQVLAQSKTGLVGPNGAGKTTIFRLITGEEAPDKGEISCSSKTIIGYFSQDAGERAGRSVVEEVMPAENIGIIRNLCAAFLFRGDDVDKRIGNLSGGEKSRVVLARLLGRPLNFLVLDEPTNHLDIQSRDVLLKALQDFSGMVILVSHDRFFLRSLVNRVFEIDHGLMRVYEGGYDYYLRQKGL